MHAADIVESAIVSFADQCVNTAHPLISALAQGPTDDGFHSRADTERISEHDGRFYVAKFVDLRGTGEFAEGVAHEDRAGDFIEEQITRVREYNGDARADVETFDEGEVSNAEPGNVGDGVPTAGLEGARSESEVPGAGAEFFLYG